MSVQARGEVSEARGERIAPLEAENEGRAEAEAALGALRIEVATLTERAAHVDELRGILKAMQERDGAGPPRHQTKPDG